MRLHSDRNPVSCLVPLRSRHPSVRVLLLPHFMLDSLGAKSEAGHIPAQLWWPAAPCVLCCVWVWGPRIAHTPPVIHWPWAAPFHVRGAWGEGKTRRSGTLPLFFFPPLSRAAFGHTSAFLTGGAVEEQEGGDSGGRRRAREKD